MEIEHIREFVVLAEASSFSDAARSLYLSEPTVSRHLGKIEAEVGAKLINRDRPYGLTEEGAVFLQFARFAIAGYEDMMFRIHPKDHLA